MRHLAGRRQTVVAPEARPTLGGCSRTPGISPQTLEISAREFRFGSANDLGQGGLIQ
jgi:hypothetical protein